MKKFRLSALVLAGALSLTLLAGCSGGRPDPTPTPPASVEPVQTPAPAPEPTPGGGADDPAPGGSTVPAAPEESGAPETSRPADTPTEPPVQTRPIAPPPSSPAPTPTPQPTREPTGDPTVLQAIWNEISELELPSLTELDGETLSAVYGIDSADLSDYVCRLPMMNVQATEFFIARVNSGKMDAVQAAVEQRQRALEEQWSSYLPEQLELVQGYKLIVNGDYIFFAVSEEADAAAEIFNRYTK